MSNLIHTLLLVAFCSSFCFSQPENISELSIKQIMKGEQFVGYLPEDIRWSFDSKKIFFTWNPDKELIRSEYYVGIRGGEIKKLEREEKGASPSRYGITSPSGKKHLFVENNKLVLLDIKKKEKKDLMCLQGHMEPIGFSKQELEIYYLHKGSVYIFNLQTGFVKQLTKSLYGKEQKRTKEGLDNLWLENQQKSIFETIKTKDKIRKIRQGRQESEKKERFLTINGDLPLQRIQISPNGDFLSYEVVENKDVKTTKVMHYVTEDGYARAENARAKVGTVNREIRLKLYNLREKKLVSLQMDSIPGIYDLPQYYKEYESLRGGGAKRRKVNVFNPVWSEDGKNAFVVICSQDNKDRWIMLLNSNTGALKLLDRQRDEAWIGGPGINSWNFGVGSFGWMPDKQSVWFQSEETGYSHLYTVNIYSGKKRQLTSGEFEIYAPFISKDKKYWYFTSNEAHPGERHFYKMPINGGKKVRLTKLEGNNKVYLSPDEKYLAILSSSSNKPWELYIKKNSSDGEPQKITESLSKEFKAYKWKKPKVTSFKAKDGTEIFARIYTPQKGKSNHAAVLFVHGAGYLQNAHKWWSSYFREYMFHNLLVDNGYTVMDIDYRGSAGYGRNFRTAIYRHMGGKDLSDYVDGVDYLVKNHQIDPQKIGIYGGSYGGFITLMAMFKHPETFKSGAALRAVADWAHYNHGYTSNILNTPAMDSLAYARSSPINFADGFQGNLLICHGMIDANVHYQDVVRLAQRLIELGKDNWEMAIYPVERHSFREASSWNDEYKRIFKLFQQTIGKK